MKQVVLKDDLLLEMWEAWERDDGRPALALRRKYSDCAVEFHLNEVRHLVDALVNATAELAEATVTPPQWSD